MPGNLLGMQTKGRCIVVEYEYMMFHLFNLQWPQSRVVLADQDDPSWP